MLRIATRNATLAGLPAVFDNVIKASSSETSEILSSCFAKPVAAVVTAFASIQALTFANVTDILVCILFQNFEGLIK